MKKDLKVFSAHRKLILLAKFCLDLLEDLKSLNVDRKDRLGDVLEEFPELSDVLIKIVDLYDPINPNFFDQSRKRILDKANELSRELESEFEGTR